MSYQDKEKVKDKEWSSVLTSGKEFDGLAEGEFVGVRFQGVGDGQQLGQGVRVA